MPRLSGGGWFSPGAFYLSSSPERGDTISHNETAVYRSAAQQRRMTYSDTSNLWAACGRFSRSSEVARNPGSLEPFQS